MENSSKPDDPWGPPKMSGEDKEAERKPFLNLISCILLFVGAASIISYWVFIPDLALYLTLFEVPFIGFLILAFHKGWIKPGQGTGF